MISAILLAAGESKRMNGENKLLKKIKNKALIKYSVENILESSIDELIIITGYQDKILKEIIGKDKKIKFVFNEKFKTGMASSIKIGLGSLSDNTKAFFISLGDMPLISKNTYDQLISNIERKEIIIPTFKKQQGNPVLFSVSMKDKIMNVKNDIGAKEILKMNKDKILNLEVNDQGILKDYNTTNNFID
tara:strand:+ start:2295 stop:2864 length:570 start_codon:yes stop_codon:yes gene_type:complete